MLSSQNYLIGYDLLVREAIEDNGSSNCRTNSKLGYRQVLAIVFVLKVRGQDSRNKGERGGPV